MALRIIYEYVLSDRDQNLLIDRESLQKDFNGSWDQVLKFFEENEGPLFLLTEFYDEGSLKPLYVGEVGETFNLRTIELRDSNLFYENGVLLGQILADEGGYYNFWPDLKGGFWPSHLLHSIADLLVLMNKDWDEKVRIGLEEEKERDL